MILYNSVCTFLFSVIIRTLLWCWVQIWILNIYCHMKNNYRVEPYMTISTKVRVTFRRTRFYLKKDCIWFQCLFYDDWGLNLIHCHPLGRELRLWWFLFYLCSCSLQHNLTCNKLFIVEQMFHHCCCFLDFFFGLDCEWDNNKTPVIHSTKWRWWLINVASYRSL